MPHHKIIVQKGFSSLEKALQFHPTIYNKLCKCGNHCTQISESNYHTFIELEIIADLRRKNVNLVNYQ